MNTSVSVDADSVENLKYLGSDFTGDGRLHVVNTDGPTILVKENGEKSFIPEGMVYTFDNWFGLPPPERNPDGSLKADNLESGLGKGHVDMSKLQEAMQGLQDLTDSLEDLDKIDGGALGNIDPNEPIYF